MQGIKKDKINSAIRDQNRQQTKVIYISKIFKEPPFVGIVLIRIDCKNISFMGLKIQKKFCKEKSKYLMKEKQEMWASIYVKNKEGEYYVICQTEKYELTLLNIILEKHTSTILEITKTTLKNKSAGGH